MIFNGSDGTKCSPAGRSSPTGTPKKSCNDDMILFFFHVTEVLKVLLLPEQGWLAS